MMKRTISIILDILMQFVQFVHPKACHSIHGPARAKCIPDFHLCASTYTYSTRDDLFAVLDAMQTANVLCAAGPQPSVTWGLLNKGEHTAWFQGTAPEAGNTVSLHDIVGYREATQTGKENLKFPETLTPQANKRHRNRRLNPHETKR